MAIGKREAADVKFRLNKNQIQEIEESLFNYSKDKLGFSEKDAEVTAKIMISGFIDKTEINSSLSSNGF